MVFNTAGQLPSEHKQGRGSDERKLATTTPLLMAAAALTLVITGAFIGSVATRLFWSNHEHTKLLEVVPKAPGKPIVPIVVKKHEEAPIVHHQQKHIKHHPSRFLVAKEQNMESLESIMYHYRSESSKDDKKYSDLYAMLFDPIRLKVHNVLDIGMGNGASMMVWHDYFRKANIYGMDKSLSRVKNYLHDLPRVRLLENDALNAKMPLPTMKTGTMDIVFESSGLGLAGQEKILPRMWPLVREGGYYVIEDVSFDRFQNKRTYPLLHHPADLPEAVLRIMTENDAFFADTTLGHRAFVDFLKQRPDDLNRYSHSAHVIVIRKRSEALRAVSVNTHGSLPVVRAPDLLPTYVKRQKQMLGLD